MDRHVIPLGDYPCLTIKNRARIVAAFFDIWREGCSSQRNAHLLSDRRIESAIDFQRGWIEGFHTTTSETVKTADGSPGLSRGVSRKLLLIELAKSLDATGSPRGGSRLLLTPEADSKEREPPPLKAVASTKVERLDRKSVV